MENIRGELDVFWLDAWLAFSVTTDRLKHVAYSENFLARKSGSVIKRRLRPLGRVLVFEM
jgi:hypothetical protein